MNNFILYSAGAFDYKKVGTFFSLEDLKKECVKHYGFPDTTLENEEEFHDWLEGTEMKYETIKIKI